MRLIVVGKFQATYKVYVGDAVTGDADPAYVARIYNLVLAGCSQ